MNTLKVLVLSVVFILSDNMCGQGLPGLDMSPADVFMENGEVDNALIEFRKIYAKEPKNNINVYNFACALTANKQIDSAFKYLKVAINIAPENNFFRVRALTDPDFIPLREDSNWKNFEDGLVSVLAPTLKNVPFAKELWDLKALDQAYYTEIRLAKKKIGRESSVVNALWKLKELQNETNRNRLELLIQKYGWPKISDVGATAASAAFLVIQHSDLQLQEKYLSVIKNLCAVNEADGQAYALMYDRIQIAKNKKQRFGSQVKYDSTKDKYELFPLENEIKVDQWRKELGLEPLNDYLANWDLTFESKK